MTNTNTDIPSKKNRSLLHGVLLLDKPVGFSSNDALIKAKRLLLARKAGHTGTLDPFATGLLPLCFGDATKFSQDLLDADKTYETVVHLGVTTTTGDTEGDVLKECSVGQITPVQLEHVLAQFRGEIVQIPPMYSALKRDGKPYYAYAREGIILEREGRLVTIHHLELINYQAPYLTLRVRCSKGTYIRVLGEDIGQALGCGAHLQSLRRTQVGHLSLSQAITLDTISNMPETERTQLLAPVDALLSSFPIVRLSQLLTLRFLQGQRLSSGKEGIVVPNEEGRVRVYSDEDGQCRLLGTAQVKEFGILAPERLVATSQSD